MRCCFVSLTAQSMFARSAVLRLIHRQLCCRCFAVSSLLRTSERHFFYCRSYQTDETIINIKLPNPYAVYVLPFADHDFVDRVADALRSELADVPVLTDDLNKHFCVDLLRIHGREMIFDFLNLALQFFWTRHRIFQSWQGSGVR